MERKYLLKTVEKALQKASGKPIREAAIVICDYIQWAEELLDDGPPPSVIQTEERLNSDIPKIVEPPPIVAPPPPVIQVAKVFRDPNELTMEVEKRMPPFLEIQIKKNGKEESLKIIRNIQAMPLIKDQEGSFGVQACYIPTGDSLNSPCPKVAFWSTDETLDFDGAVAKIRDLATKQYGWSPPAVVQSKRPPDPGHQSFGIRADV